jgi:ABC-type polysaccharide/polyol phosphate transport system ATPase subunit
MKEKETTIKLENISKTFNRDYKKRENILFRILSFLSGKKNKNKFLVLDNVSLQAKSGENVGIIGKNGSGKSTLLRIIAGIYQANNGKIKTKGKVIYLTGFGQGLKPKLTMRENIFLIGSIRGLSQKEIKQKLNEITEFAGLEDYIDTKVYQFSSGMLTRLSFSITIHCIAHQDPDILLIDEAIGAGADITFQNKAANKMEELIKGGATVILVSHNLGQIKKYCDRVIILENGRIKNIGNPKKIIQIYKKRSTHKKSHTKED